MSVYGSGTNKSSTLNYPTIRPTLDLNFAASKTLDPRITFTRSSGGTYVGPDGLIKYAGVNEPRFDHDPVTGESLGLLIEESRSNLFTYSQNFENTFSFLTVTTNQTIAPDGTLTADKIKRPPDSGNSYISVSPTLSTNTNYCFSAFIKLVPNTGTIPICTLSSANALINPVYAQLVFNFVTKQISTNLSSAYAYGVIPYPNDWYRLYMVFNSSTQTNANLEIRPFPNNNVSDFYIWGAQVEAGTFPTSYIPTLASTRTRTIGNALISGTDFSSWYNGSEGTFAFKAYQPNGLGTNPVIGLGAGTGSFNQGFVSLGIARDMSWWQGGNDLNTGLAIGFNINTAVWSKGIKGAGSYSISGRSSCLNGTNVASNTSLLPNGGLIRIGQNYNNTSTVVSSTIDRITYWPKKLSNPQLQALTR